MLNAIQCAFLLVLSAPVTQSIAPLLTRGRLMPVPVDRFASERKHSR